MANERGPGGLLLRTADGTAAQPSGQGAPQQIVAAEAGAAAVIPEPRLSPAQNAAFDEALPYIHALQKSVNPMAHGALEDIALQVAFRRNGLKREAAVYRKRWSAHGAAALDVAARAYWQADKAVQSEFSKPEMFSGYVRGIAEGRIRGIGID